MWPALEGYPEPHVSPHTHAQPAVVRVGVIRGKAKIKETTLES